MPYESALNERIKFLFSRVGRFLLFPVAVFFLGCTGPTNRDFDGVSDKLPDSAKSVNPQFLDSAMITQNGADSIVKDNLEDLTVSSQQASRKKSLDNAPVRYIEFPGDANFNGKPMTQQENISRKILEQNIDTLKNLAISRYKSYDHFFPRSIADNFDEGISTEHIHYPKYLIFRFELFDNESAFRPYLIKDIVVRRGQNGELNAE